MDSSMQEAWSNELNGLYRALGELKQNNQEGEFYRQYMKMLDLQDRAGKIGLVAHYDEENGWCFAPRVMHAKSMKEMEEEKKDDPSVHLYRRYEKRPTFPGNLPLDDGSGK